LPVILMQQMPMIMDSTTIVTSSMISLKSKEKVSCLF
jgi:hypothetical protein